MFTYITIDTTKPHWPQTTRWLSQSQKCGGTAHSHLRTYMAKVPAAAPVMKRAHTPLNTTAAQRFPIQILCCHDTYGCQIMHGLGCYPKTCNGQHGVNTDCAPCSLFMITLRTTSSAFAMSPHQKDSLVPDTTGQTSFSTFQHLRL